MIELQQHHENRYTAFHGRLYLERRPSLSPYWQVRTSFTSVQQTRTTKCKDLRSAAEWAEKWYLEIQYRLSKGESIKTRYPLRVVYREFIKWHEKLVETGESSERKVKRYRYTWNNIAAHLGETPVQNIDFDTLQLFKDRRVEKAQPRKLTGKTLKADLDFIRLLLKYSIRRKWLDALVPFPTVTIKHVSPDWFELDEYKRLVKASRERYEAVLKKNPHHYAERRELHAFILMMAHSCIRVDECLHLRWQDCVEAPENKRLKHYRDKTVQLRISDGKVGFRKALGMFGAVRALEHLAELYPNAKPEDRLFRTEHSKAFENLLIATNLRKDSKGRLRNQKTLRHTSIMMRCLFNRQLSTAELSVISGTSMQSLEKYYLRHLKAAHIQRRLIDSALAAE